jgi:hypothetical protein
MPYCTQCLIEYVEGTSQCEDCGAILSPGSPPEAPPRVEIQHEKDVKLVPVRIFTGGTAHTDADVAQGVLESQRIPCTVSGEGAGEPFPVVDVQLLVREEDLDQAPRVLDAYLNSETPATPEDPDEAEGS